MHDVSAWKRDSEGYFVEMYAGAKKDYSVDLVDWLGADTIAVATLDVPAGLTLVGNPVVNGTLVQWVFIAGGGGACACRLHLTTGGGLIEILPFRVLVTA